MNLQFVIDQIQSLAIIGLAVCVILLSAVMLRVLRRLDQ